MIEGHGARRPYVYFVTAAKIYGNTVYARKGKAFDAADSEDEAYGRAMKICMLRFPPSDGWAYHDVVTVDIGGIEWVGRHDMGKIEPCGDPSDSLH
jgi:hypothetical protein